MGLAKLVGAQLSIVSAYAPVDPRGPSELLAGRGLY